MQNAKCKMQNAKEDSSSQILQFATCILHLRKVVKRLLVLCLLGGVTFAQEKVPPKDEYFLGPTQKLEIEVHIWGEVTKPGVYRVPEESDVLELISLAGGPTEYANLSAIKLTHRNRQTNRIIKVNLEHYLNQKEKPDSLPLLEPNDTVRVPKNVRYLWRSFIGLVADLAIIANVYYLISRNK
ncbi:MAG: SLBB domain-containing protein [Candidatus Edwardsbacteria bacterium]